MFSIMLLQNFYLIEIEKTILLFDLFLNLASIKLYIHLTNLMYDYTCDYIFAAN